MKSKKLKTEVSEKNSIRQILSKFLTNLCEKKYSEAHKDLEDAVQHKVNDKIKKTAKDLKEKKNSKKGSKQR